LCTSAMFRWFGTFPVFLLPQLGIEVYTERILILISPMPLIICQHSEQNGGKLSKKQQDSLKHEFLKLTLSFAVFCVLEYSELEWKLL
jgi:hypothetical protein